MILKIFFSFFFIAIPERPESIVEDPNNNIINGQDLHKANKRNLQKSYKSLANMTSQEHECTYCLKIFQSKATLDIHLMTKRHDWQLKKAIENMNSVDNATTTTMVDDFSKHYLTSGRNGKNFLSIYKINDVASM